MINLLQALKTRKRVRISKRQRRFLLVVGKYCFHLSEAEVRKLNYQSTELLSQGECNEPAWDANN